ncbi:carbohydrate ABC transporter permease [Vagococcus elongatus]|uniref:Sugar ABC transporter permease n=1 Tax=Vagococcus elongatus TaxID=180344 RepID=A0A430AQF5_9ENTE|nr:sugar ABC transporter permease [Vagococcus elongatus]RSU10349.1 sugar ABC transporter permease [Vagococcus elongatus]
MKRIKKINYTSWLFILPAILVIVSLLLYPVLSSVVYSFTSKHLTRPVSTFVGLQNYKKILADEQFYKAFFMSIKWTVASIGGQVILGFILAMLLNSIKIGKKMFRVLLIVPWAFPVVVIAVIWKFLLNGVYGFIPTMLVNLGLTDTLPQFLSSGTLVFPTILFVNLWFGTPMIMVNILSALQTIPEEQYEAAKMDGASTWQTFVSVTIPHISKVVGLLVILRTIWVFTNFDMVYLLTGGGPANVTMTLPIYAYKMGWGLKLLGKSSAITIIMLIFLLIVCSIYFYYSDKKEKENV